ncbi:hypothetical protein ALP13_04540 [Pseudomonas syringae pv. maculicola]|uniref:Uncharacterized protein n=1 Tax=Pseudomonas syringae pv. maculicola TaxID=59511 RepID=A0A3M6BFE4_PSEYM|nr:hypothetical protein ALP13_04540 [Pseudomonas syringae pv. maculicola]
MKAAGHFQTAIPVGDPGCQLQFVAFVGAGQVVDLVPDHCHGPVQTLIFGQVQAQKLRMPPGAALQPGDIHGIIGMPQPINVFGADWRECSEVRIRGSELVREMARTVAEIGSPETQSSRTMRIAAPVAPSPSGRSRLVHDYRADAPRRHAVLDTLRPLCVRNALHQSGSAMSVMSVSGSGHLFAPRRLTLRDQSEQSPGSVSGPTSSGSFALTLIRGSPQRAILGPVRLARRPAEPPPDQCQGSAVTYVAIGVVSDIAMKKRFRLCAVITGKA